MNRRTLLTTVSTTTVVTLAGCGSDTTRSPTTEPPRDPGSTETDTSPETAEPTETGTKQAPTQQAKRALEGAYTGLNDFAMVKGDSVTVSPKIMRLYQGDRVQKAIVSAEAAIETARDRGDATDDTLTKFEAAVTLAADVNAQYQALVEGILARERWADSFKSAEYTPAADHIETATTEIQTAGDAISPIMESLSDNGTPATEVINNADPRLYYDRENILKYTINYLYHAFRGFTHYTEGWERVTASLTALENGTYGDARSRLEEAKNKYQETREILTEERINESNTYVDRMRRVRCLMPGYIEAVDLYLQAVTEYEDGNTAKGESLVSDAEARFQTANETCTS